MESCKEGIKAWGWRVSRRRPRGEAGGIGLAGLLPMVKAVKKNPQKNRGSSSCLGLAPCLGELQMVASPSHVWTVKDLAGSGQIAQKAEAVQHRSSQLHCSNRENEKKEKKE